MTGAIRQILVSDLCCPKILATNDLLQTSNSPSVVIYEDLIDVYGGNA